MIYRFGAAGALTGRNVPSISARRGSSQGGNWRRAPQFFLALVHQEAGAGGGEFDDMAVRVGGVDALEVDAVHHRRDAQARADQPFAEGELRLLVGDGEGDSGASGPRPAVPGARGLGRARSR